MTDEQLKIINKVATRLSKKYKFDIYDSDDIFQELFIIALDGLNRYDETMNVPLENFLSAHLSNRVKTLMRDKYCRPKPDNLTEDEERAWERGVGSKLKLMNPIPLSSVNDTLTYEDFLIDKLEQEEVLHIIDKHLPVSLRPDFIRLRDGEHVAKPRRIKLFDIIREILSEEGYDVPEGDIDGI